MSVPLIIWGCTAGAFSVAAVAGIVNLVLDKRRCRNGHKCSERELLYVPGDPLHDDDHDYDCTE